jgi:hypothetical protein
MYNLTGNDQAEYLFRPNAQRSKSNSAFAKQTLLVTLCLVQPLAVFGRAFITAKNFKSTKVGPYEILWEMQVTQLLRTLASPNNEYNCCYGVSILKDSEI